MAPIFLVRFVLKEVLGFRVSGGIEFRRSTCGLFGCWCTFLTESS